MPLLLLLDQLIILLIFRTGYLINFWTARSVIVIETVAMAPHYHEESV